MFEPKITIIVPVYKVEPYIRKCVESIIDQTYQRIEVILVDDGSPDNCGAICDEYARTDSRIIVIHTENEGVYCARNKALDVATGDYLMFVDSDDWVEPDFCETALRLAQENNVQMVAFMFNNVFEDRDHSITEKRPAVFRKPGYMEASEAVRHLILRDSSLANYLCNKLFKRSLFEGFRFPKGRVLQDQAATYLMMLRAGRIYVSNAVLYNYLQHSGSITATTRYSFKMFASLFAIWQERLPILRQYCPENVRHQMMQLADLSVKGLIFIRPDSESEQLRNDMKGFLQTNKAYLLRGHEKRRSLVKLYLYYYCRPLHYMIKYKIVVRRFLMHFKKKNLSYYD